MSNDQSDRSRAEIAVRFLINHLRQSVRDYFVNQQFRRATYLSKGAHTGSQGWKSPAVQTAIFRSDYKSSRHADESNWFAGRNHVAGECLQTRYRNAFRKNNFRAKALQNWQRTIWKDLNIAQLVQSVLVLTAQAPKPCTDPRQTSARAVREVEQDHLRPSSGRADISYLASPVAASGIPVPRFEQLSLLPAMKGSRRLGTRQIRLGCPRAPRSASDQGRQSPGERGRQYSGNWNRQAQEFIEKRKPCSRDLRSFDGQAVGKSQNDLGRRLSHRN